MQINKVAFIGKGGVGLLYGSMIAQALGNDAVEYVMDDERFDRHVNDALTVNGEPCALKSVRASEATPADLVILTVKTTGLDQALKTMERVVGPSTLIASLCNGITSEQK
ncbi:MAG: ketopantoate reductase family protein, partial [Collinsella sp.]